MGKTGDIKGITVEIGGEVTPLKKALKDVNSTSKELSTELKQVDRLLKFDPSNVTLLGQKQELLSKSIENTSNKLDALRQAQSKVEEEFRNGDIGEKQYRDFQRELIATEGQLNKFKDKLKEIEAQSSSTSDNIKSTSEVSKDLGNELKEVNSLLKLDPSNATLLKQKYDLLSSSIDNTSNVLEKLKEKQESVENQFKNGDIGESQYRSFQREIVKTENKLNGLREELKKVGNDDSIDELKKDLSKIPSEAESAKNAISDIGIEVENVAGALVAGGGIAGAIETALDMSSINTKIDISMEVPESSKASVKEAINIVNSYGVDAEEALEGVRRQWALNKNASDESNKAVVEGAATIAAAYSGIDFNELIQETNEVSKTFNITNQEALGLTNSLLKMGFPPEQLDIISEYGTQLKMAGFNAMEIQAIMAAGVETGTWNIDNLLDGLKEGRIKLAEFGQEVPKATAELLQGTSISTKQLQTWGQAVAKGGESGTKAMQEVAKALMGVENETQRNALGVQFFGTMYEDQGTNIVDTLANMGNHLTTTKQNQDQLNQSTQKLSADPAVQMQKAIGNLKVALEPLLKVIAEVISKIAEWVSNNPTLAATITAIVTALGILMGVMMALAPIFTAMTMAVTAFGIGMLPLTGIILGIVAGISALIAVGVVLYKHWDTLKAKTLEVWNSIVSFFTETIPAWIENIKLWFQGLPEYFSTLWENIKQFFINGWNNIVNFFTVTIPEWISSVAAWFGELPGKIGYALGVVLGNIIKWGVDTWNYLVTNVPLWINGIINWFKELPGKVWTWLTNTINKITTWGIQMQQKAYNAALNAINAIINWFKELPGKLWTWLTNTISKLATFASQMGSKAKEAAKNFVTWLIDGVKSLPEKMAGIGKDIVEGIWNGIKNMGSWLMGKVGDFFGGIVDGVKDVLGIHSPSRVFRDEIGKMMAKGIGIGFEDEMKNINYSMKNSLQNTTKDFSNLGGSQSLERGSSLGNLSNINGEVKIYLNISSPIPVDALEASRLVKKSFKELSLGMV